MSVEYNLSEGQKILVDTAWAINHLQPKTNFGRGLIGSLVWGEPLYYHEKVMLFTWVFLVEKRYGTNLDLYDAEAFFRIVNWVNSLDEDLLKTGRSLERNSEAPLLLSSQKEQIGVELDWWRSGENFFQPGWPAEVVYCARRHIEALQVLGRSPLDFDNIERSIIYELGQSRNKPL